ncbi:aldehyde dehydrogenase family protein [Spartinivicinus poritis]|uniref:Aldehyde dehydrogenase family protein n=1 Tax=Spartinivicinus poritis TaxID=2994640 RepID=A0ABT5UAP9_9GAMM|nr:aldehyde dehydrogenase family protein [Spartinivicinus sp. A2-2]MDE1463449.1 aldehyde dehydrogenase family protein [Spartinivicinus sp. A2-2]
MSTSAAFQTISPINNQVWLERPYANNKQIAATLEKATKAQQLWCKLPLNERIAYCQQAMDYCLSQQQAIGRDICWQMGRPLLQAEREVAVMVERASYMLEVAELALAPAQLPATAGFNNRLVREPLGLVMVIAPWNYPLLTAINSIIPALVAGNGVILKHSSQTPRCAEWLAEAFKQAQLPEGVFQYLHLDHHTAGELLTANEVNHVVLTGSVSAGKQVEHQLAGHFKTLGLELGGKDAAYIRPDADLTASVASIVDGAFYNSGQSCCGVERLYIHQEVYDQCLPMIIDTVKQYRLGHPELQQTTLGPMVSASAASQVQVQIQQAIAQGAEAQLDSQLFVNEDLGQLPLRINTANSAYLAPQVLTGVNHQMAVMMEETFGPLLPVMKVNDDQQAIALINDSDYGLTAAIYSQDNETTQNIASQLAVGTVFLNRCDYLDPALAWTGVKASGKGYCLSAWGYETVTRPKSYHFKEQA